MDADRKAESRWKTARHVVPASTAIGGTPDAVMVLLIEQVGGTGCPHHVVDAMPDFAVAGRRGVGIFGAGLVCSIAGCGDPRFCRHPPSQRRRPPKSRPRAFWRSPDQTISYAEPIRLRQDSNCRQTDDCASLPPHPNSCRRRRWIAALPVWFRHRASRERRLATRFARTDLRMATVGWSSSSWRRVADRWPPSRRFDPL